MRIEQLYPFHKEMVRDLLSTYPNASHLVWCQEEPLNMGAWSYVRSRLDDCTGQQVRYAGREAASSPAEGSKAAHKRAQAALLEQAFTV